MKKLEPVLIDGRTIKEWSECWIAVPHGLTAYQLWLRHQVGLFRVCYRGRVMFIGVGTDKSGGIPKRLRDLFRPSPSGRNHHAGQLIYENRDLLTVDVLITGENKPAARELAQHLKKLMIALHQPPWNAPAKLVQAERVRRYAMRR
jgi:hypothetical protein